MLPPNTAVHSDVMHSVLQHLPHMSGRIVDDTRHEKVLTYMHLFLSTPNSLSQLQTWNALAILSQCLQPPCDTRVSSVAVRFLADAVAHPDGRVLWTLLFEDHPGVVQWICCAGDSADALERLAAVYFLRRAVERHWDARVEELLALADVARLVVRRALDQSHYVAHEAARLLAALCWQKGSVQDEWITVACGIGVPLPRLQVARVLLSHVRLEVRRAAAAKMVLGDALDHADRGTRDCAMDVLEGNLRVTQNVGEALDAVGKLPSPHVLRALAAVVRACPDHPECLRIAQACSRVLMHDEVVFDLAPGVHVSGRRLNVDVARVLGAYAEHAWDTCVAQALSGALTERPVVRVAVLRAVLQAARSMLVHVPADESAGLLHAVGALVGDFGVPASALRTVLDACARAIAGGRADADFTALVVDGLRQRLADVSWEGRDLAAEFVGTCVASGSRLARQMAMQLAEDLVAAVDDPDEHVRASAAAALAAMVNTWGLDALPSGIAGARLSQLLHDPEAFVRRAAADLLYALAQGTTSVWLSSVDSLLLRRLSRDEDYEVRVRCARVLGLLTWQKHFEPNSWDADDDKIVGGLAVDTLLVEMCGDESRYVRRVCFDRLVAMRDACEPASTAQDEKEKKEDKEMNEGKRAKTLGADDPKAAFCRRLAAVDFVRLEQSLDVEHLYSEALDAPVTRGLMDEDDDVNCGNNILECY
ncbi:hypothetical protein GGI05_000413 [Coemansia sp. RSA 2603]|nr:hypothetical protein GGI05_000413 [Coemansia sp. RSA 2603]